MQYKRWFVPEKPRNAGRGQRASITTDTAGGLNNTECNEDLLRTQQLYERGLVKLQIALQTCVAVRRTMQRQLIS